MKTSILAFWLILATGIVLAEEYPFQLHGALNYDKEGKPVLRGPIVEFVEKMKDPKPMGFIVTKGMEQGKPWPKLKWRVSRVNVITSDVVAFVFSEGHVEVVGVYERDLISKSWKLIAEVGGSITVKAYKDNESEPRANKIR